MTHKDRYQAIHEQWFAKTYPAAYCDGHYSAPTMPPIRKANGLTRYITNVLFWYPKAQGTRINSQGRMLQESYTNVVGQTKTLQKWIPGTTAAGTADIVGVINGRAVNIEIKVGTDRPRPAQLAMQSKVREAGGVYEFISTPDEFWALWDRLVSL
jgi:hypothetical protein